MSVVSCSRENSPASILICMGQCAQRMPAGFCCRWEMICFSEEPHNQYSGHAGDGGDEEVFFDERCDHADGKCSKSCERVLRCLQDGREGHDGERYVRYVVEKGSQEAASDLPAEKKQRQEPDQIDSAAHDEQGEIDVMHDPPPFQQLFLQRDGKIRIPESASGRLRFRRSERSE